MASLEQRLRKEHQTDLQAVPWIFVESAVPSLTFSESRAKGCDVLKMRWPEATILPWLIRPCESLVIQAKRQGSDCSGQSVAQFLQSISCCRCLSLSFCCRTCLIRSRVGPTSVHVTQRWRRCTDDWAPDYCRSSSFGPAGWVQLLITEGQCRAWARGPVHCGFMGWMDDLSPLLLRPLGFWWLFVFVDGWCCQVGLRLQIEHSNNSGDTQMVDTKANRLAGMAIWC